MENTTTQKHYEYGIAGIARIFNCSLTIARKLKKSGKISGSIIPFGRSIIIDIEMALKLNVKCKVTIEGLQNEITSKNEEIEDLAKWNKFWKESSDSWTKQADIWKEQSNFWKKYNSGKPENDTDKPKIKEPGHLIQFRPNALMNKINHLEETT